MVIQRIQSLFLLIAAVLMVLLCFVVPIADNVMLDSGPRPVYISAILALLVLCLVTAVLLVVDIFLYKNLPLQIKLARICIVLTIVVAAYIGFVWYSIDGVKPLYVGPALMLLGILVLSILALNGMNKDLNLLRSYDRLR